MVGNYNIKYIIQKSLIYLNNGSILTMFSEFLEVKFDYNTLFKLISLSFQFWIFWKRILS